MSLLSSFQTGARRSGSIFALWFGMLGAFAADEPTSESATAAPEPFLKPHDVIAFVGGEDMVAASEYGYLELLLTRALPDYKLRFRCLAWEGDTVFEQRRDLNYPTLEQQLDRIGATVVICQFGQMESLASFGSASVSPAEPGGPPSSPLSEFATAYEKLLARLSGGGKRRMFVVTPTPFVRFGDADEVHAKQYRELFDFAIEAKLIAERIGAPVAHLFVELGAYNDHATAPDRRDGVHLNERGLRALAWSVRGSIMNLEKQPPTTGDERLFEIADSWPAAHPMVRLRELIRAKNRLWFQYSRPQNWAFLAGDRTNQPSSRDHLDPSKRWFPAELEQFVPLIEAKEREIDALAAQLSKAPSADLQK